jgi:hypothetical protein
MTVSPHASAHSPKSMHGPLVHPSSSKHSALASLTKFRRGGKVEAPASGKSFAHHLAHKHAAFNPSPVLRGMSLG